MLCNKKLIVCCVVNLVIIWGLDALTIRGNFMDSLKMLGKNDRRLFISHQSYYDKLSSGISNKIADLVSQSFAPARNTNNRYNIRQDAIVVGDDGPSMIENPLMSGMLKMLGLDGAKIGAAAVNGVIFIAQMVKYGAFRFMDYMMTKTWDWYKIVDSLNEKVNNETITETSAAPQRIIF